MHRLVAGIAVGMLDSADRMVSGVKVFGDICSSELSGSVGRQKIKLMTGI